MLGSNQEKRAMVPAIFCPNGNDQWYVRGSHVAQHCSVLPCLRHASALYIVNRRDCMQRVLWPCSLPADIALRLQPLQASSVYVCITLTMHCHHMHTTC